MNRQLRMNRIGLPGWVSIAVVVTATGLTRPGVAGVEMRVHPRDVVWVDPQLERIPPTNIAVLPAVAFVDNPEALRLVEVYGSLLLAETGHVALPAQRVREAMAGVGQRPDLYPAMARQVRTRGVIDAQMASRLARLAQAPMLMSLRIDRWEVVDGRAQVEISAALVDSTGRLLWRISGLAGHGGGGPSRIAITDPPLTAWVGGTREYAGREIQFEPNGPRLYAERLAERSRLDPDRVGDPERALRSLMNRWVAAMPNAGDPDAPSLAVANARLQPAAGH